MKIYFNASLVGKEKYIKEFKAIIEAIKELGHEVFAEHIMDRNYKEVNKQSHRQHEVDFQRVRKQIKNSDVMIVEATYPSIGVGHMMTVALDMYKSVLVLHQNTPHGILIGDPNRLLTVKKYSIKNPKKLKNIIKNFVKRAERRFLTKRFNFMIDSALDEYLEKAAKKEGISKANFLRRIIYEYAQAEKGER